MNTYIALLRGINVSGQKKILMADLKKLFEDLQFDNVQTYIQSGNVIFQTKATSTHRLEQKIEHKIKEHYGFDVTTFVITPGELAKAVNDNPFLRQKDKDIDRVYIALLSETPKEELLEKLKSTDYGKEEFIVTGKILYFYVPEGFSNSKFSNNFFEQKLKLRATTRNLKTMNKLITMSKM